MGGESSRSRILVTGGAGFIGAHLCRRLLEEDLEPVCLDNFSTGSRANLLHLGNGKSLEVHEHDVCEPFDFEVDGVVHLACPASPVHYQADPIRTVRTNVFGAVNVLELARRQGVPVLFSSTSEVYGDPDVHPQPESYAGRVNPIGPRACYDEGKRCAETLFFDYHRVHGVRIKVARIFNTYGPLMHPNDGRVVSNFIVQALQNRPLTIFGNGTQTRSFCYVDDMIDGLVAFYRAPAGEPGPLNLGNPEEHAVLDLAEAVLDVTGSRSMLKFEPLPADDPTRRKPDISRARRALGWRPTTPLRAGLERTALYFDWLLRRHPDPRQRPRGLETAVPSGR